MATMATHYLLVINGHYLNDENQLTMNNPPCLPLLCLLIMLLPSNTWGDHHHHDTNHPHQRKLAIGDFADFNQILQGAVLRIPNAQFNQDGATLKLSNVKCKDLAIDDVDLASSSSPSGVEVHVQITNLDMSCQANYQFSAWWLFGGGGSGTVNVGSRGNDAYLMGLIYTSSLRDTYPTEIDVRACNPTVYINEIKFSDGGIFGSVLNIFQGILRRFMESQTRIAICDQLKGAMGETKGFLQDVKQILQEYEPNIYSNAWDPLWAEQVFGLSADDTNILDFGENSTMIATWFESGVNQAIDYLSSPAEGTADIQANILLRQHILDRNGALEIESSDFSSNGSYNSVIHEGHNRITKTSVQFDSVRMVGLDSLKYFKPLNVIGSYTAQNEISWDYLGFEIQATIVMTPSTKGNSIIATSKDVRVEEQVEIFVGIDDLDAELSIISLFDQDLLELVELGSLLQLENILPCLQSTIKHIDITSLAVNANNVRTPTMNGFVSPGMDRIFSSSMDAGLLLYEEIVLQAAPRFFQEEVRPLFASMVLETIVGDGGDFGSCALPPNSSLATSSGLMDFRDLLLPPLDARLAGATGLEPYGNIFHSLIAPYLQENMLQSELLNDGYIRPLTLTQSGMEGSLVFSNTLFQHRDSTSSLLYDSLVFTVSDLRFHNLDTVVDPMSLLHPVDWNTLNNTIAFGGVDNLVVTVRIGLDIGANNSPLKMQNTLDLSLSFPSSALSFEIMASLRESSVMSFPVFDLANIHCWLASLDSLVLSSLSLGIDSFRLGSNCVSCSTPGVGLISELLEYLETIGFNSLYKDDIVAVLEGLITDYTQNFDLESLVEAAPKSCPHHPSYDPASKVLDFPWTDLPAFRSDSAETTIAIGMIALQCAIIGAAKNQLLLVEAGEYTNDTAPMLFSEGSRIVNWTTLDEDFGSWAVVALEELRSYLKRTVQESPLARSTRLDLQLNEILRNNVLDSNGAFAMHFNELEFAAMDFGLTLKAVKVYGLDSIIDLDVFVIDTEESALPQMLKNRVQFERLSVVFEVELSSSSTEAKPMLISYELQDIIAQVDMSLALDLDIIETIKLGSVFDISRIIPCAVSAIQGINLSTIAVGFERIGNSTIDGYFSDDNHQNIQYIYDALLDTYRADLIDGLPLLFDSLLKEILNVMFPDILESASEGCIPPIKYPSTGIVDFRDFLLTETLSSSLGGSGISPYGNLFQTIYDIMQEKVFQRGASNRPLINDLVRKFTGHLSNETGSMFFQGNMIEHSGQIKFAGLDATFGLTISEVAIENIDSAGDPLDIFRPVFGEANILNNTISFGVDSKPLRVTGKVLLSLFDGAGIQMRNEMGFSLSVENVMLVASVFLHLSENNLASFPLRDLTNIHCWLSAISSKLDQRGSNLGGIGILDQSFSVEGISLEANCTSCSSPQFDDLLLSLYDFSNSSTAISSLLDSDFIHVYLDNAVDESARKCPHRSEFDPSALGEGFLLSPTKSFGVLQKASVDKPIYFTAINSAFAGIIFMLGIFCRGIVKYRNKQWIQALSHEGRVHLESQQKKETQMIEMLNKSTTSLFKSECINKRVRYGVPLVLALNLGLFFGAHVAVIYAVNVEGNLAGEELMVNKFMEVTFTMAARNAYSNGGKEVAILLWLFGCIWPYIKVFLSLLMWMVPPERLCVVKRKTTLLWCDVGAKLSIIDIAMMVLGSALLLIFIGGPDESYVSEDMMYSLKAILVPRAGFYCMLIAQRISRLSSRFLLDIHEKVIKTATEDFMDKENTQRIDGSNSNIDNDQSRQSHLSSLDEESSSSVVFQAQCSTEEAIEASSILLSDEECFETIEPPTNEKHWGFIGVYFGAITIGIIFIIGCIFAPSVSLDASSIAAMAIESDKTYEEIVQSYGVFSVICGILLQARFVFDDTTSYLGFGFLLFSAVVSVGAVFVMKVYKFAKQKLAERQSAYLNTPSFGHKGCGIPFYIRLRKWRHMEIYLISVAVGYWQLGSIIGYSIYLYCELLNRLFSFMAFVGLATQPNAGECYNIQSALPDNLGIILGSFGFLFATFFLQAYSQYRKNVLESLCWIDNDDIPHLSLAWSQDSSKNRKYSYIASTRTASMSWDSTKDSTRNSRGTATVQVSESIT